MFHETLDFLQRRWRKVGETVGLVPSVVVPEVDSAACGLVEFDYGFALSSIVSCRDEVGWRKILRSNGWECVAFFRFLRFLNGLSRRCFRFRFILHRLLRHWSIIKQASLRHQIRDLVTIMLN